MPGRKERSTVLWRPFSVLRKLLQVCSHIGICLLRPNPDIFLGLKSSSCQTAHQEIYDISGTEPRGLVVCCYFLSQSQFGQQIIQIPEFFWLAISGHTTFAMLTFDLSVKCPLFAHQNVSRCRSMQGSTYFPRNLQKTESTREEDLDMWWHSTPVSVSPLSQNIMQYQCNPVSLGNDCMQ